MLTLASGSWHLHQSLQGLLCSQNRSQRMNLLLRRPSHSVEMADSSHDRLRVFKPNTHFSDGRENMVRQTRGACHGVAS